MKISFLTVTESEPKTLIESVACFYKGLHSYEHLWLSSSGMSEGYNELIKKAAGDVLVFVHDDVTFLCNKIAWDMALGVLDKPGTGFIGVAGTRKLQEHGCWWDYRDTGKYLRGMVLHHDLGTLTEVAKSKGHSGEFLPYYVNTWPTWGAGYFGDVAVLDGVFLACKKETAHRLEGFDARTFTGFDFYDIDITLRASIAGLRNWVVPLPMLHRSARPIGEEWYRDREKFVAEYSRLLPYQLVGE